jgi:hypothetical protein
MRRPCHRQRHNSGSRSSGKWSRHDVHPVNSAMVLWSTRCGGGSDVGALTEGPEPEGLLQGGNSAKRLFGALLGSRRRGAWLALLPPAQAEIASRSRARRR